MLSNPTATEKPSKPYPEFPLFPHATKRWAKKIRGQLHYFGHWDNWQAALDKYMEQGEALHAGRKPRQVSLAETVQDLASAYLAHKEALRDAGELSPRTLMNCKEATDVIISQFGRARIISDLDQSDFAGLRKWMARKWGPVRLGDFIQRVRCVFKFAYDTELLAAPVRFGPGFTRPSKKTLRLERVKRGPKMFEAAEIRALVDGLEVEGHGGRRLVQPTPTLKAMILLGVNCGFGNADCGTLPLSALDLDRGWVSYHRVKTGITRRCPLWPETVDALRAALSERKAPNDRADEGLFFITYKGGRFHKAEDRNPISAEMRKLLNALASTATGTSTPSAIPSRRSGARRRIRSRSITSWVTPATTWRASTASGSAMND